MRRVEVRMRLSVPAIAAAVLLVSSPARAQESRPFGVEAGVVMGIIAVPYPTVGVVAAPWSVRVSGGRAPGVVNCYGVQVNLGRVLREKGNAKHTVGAVWAGFRDGCWTDNTYTSSRSRQSGGRYFGLAYDFQVKGFFVEAGPGFGSRNPVSSAFTGGLFDHVYGQIGYVHRFGRKYRDDDEAR
jgi:hypothetical protein